MLISWFSISFRFLVFLLKLCRDMNFVLRPKQLASDVICRAIVPVNEFLEHVNFDINKMLK